MSVKIGLLRCAGNDHSCPLTGCFKCMSTCQQGFAGYDSTELKGVFTVDESADETVKLAKVMKAKGAEVIHISTCAFARKRDGKWLMGGGFVDDCEGLMQRIALEAEIPCVMGAAHLPEGYELKKF